jgi:hypothetical protein
METSFKLESHYSPLGLLQKMRENLNIEDCLGLPLPFSLLLLLSFFRREVHNPEEVARPEAYKKRERDLKKERVSYKKRENFRSL